MQGQYEKPFGVKILDSTFTLVTTIDYISLQWDREYNEVGKFVIEGVLGDYNRSTWKYVYTEQRRELGIISQVNWRQENGRQILTISGLFAESELNKMVCYAKPTKFDDDSGTHYGTSILSTGSPTWVTVDNTADVVAQTFFNGFKQISFRNYLVKDFGGSQIVTKSFTLPISFGTIEAGTYHRSIHNRNNEYLGDKLYDILQESGASIEIEFDYDEGTKTLNIVHGVDRTQEGHAFGVNPVVLSTMNGSVKSASIVTSNTDTKDVMIQVEEDDEQTLVLANALSGSIGRFLYKNMSTRQNDFTDRDTEIVDDTGHKLAVMGDASLELNEKRDLLNIQFDFVSSSYRYMEDFDLGDKITVNIPEIDVSLDTQIVSCHEAVKQGVWELNIEVGTNILRKRGNI